MSEEEFYRKQGLTADISELKKFVGGKYTCSRCNEAYNSTFETLGYCPKCQKYFDRLMKKLRNAVGYHPRIDYRDIYFWIENDWVVIDKETGDVDQEATIKNYKLLEKKHKNKFTGLDLAILKHKLLILENIVNKV